MAVKLYMDVHVPWAITDQLRIREVDVLTAQEDEADRLPDEELLERANELERAIFSQDIRFKAMAETWQRDGRPFRGLIFGHQLHGTIGKYVFTGTTRRFGERKGAICSFALHTCRLLDRSGVVVRVLAGTSAFAKSTSTRDGCRGNDDNCRRDGASAVPQ